MLKFFLRDIFNASTIHDLSKLERLINQLFRFTPIPIVSVEKGSEIQRIRNNFHGEIFIKEKEISFRTDPWDISEFGRCNFPNSSKFYGSLSSKYLNEIRVANVLETNKEFRENQAIRKRQVFTSGQWRVNSSLNVAIFPFNIYAGKVNKEIQLHSEKYQSIIKDFNTEEQQIANSVLPFISAFYAKRKIINHWDYLISAFCSEIIVAKYNIDGILYPSVRAGFKTYNIMLEPNAASTKLDFTKAAMFELFLNRKHGFIDNIATGYIQLNKTISWTHLEKTSERKLCQLLR